MSELNRVIREFYSLLQAGNTEVLQSIFAGEPALDTPLQGAVKGREAFAGFVEEQAGWLQKYQARPESLSLVDTPERLVAEYVLYLTQDGQSFDLPVAIAFDRQVQGQTVSEARVYHSTWPLNGKHKFRPGLLSPVAGLEEPEIVRQYMAALDKADKEGLLATFEEDGYVREPSGSPYTHAGREGREAFYSLVGAEGGVSLKHCTATFDGKIFAVEYICDEWGRKPMPPQSGIAIYELGNTGRILGVRIYDDITPPHEAEA